MLFHLLEKFRLQAVRSLKLTRRSTRVSAEAVDICAARLFTIVLLVAVVLSANLIVVHASPQTGSAERALFDAANSERAAQGFTQLRWDDTLAKAANEHALLMAQRNALSHQFPGEPALQDRARATGARFTEIAENVAEGPSADVIHSSWMHSPPHRANLLDPQLTAIGIAVVGTGSRDGAGSTGTGFGRGGAGMLFAVEDFSQSVASLSLPEQERQVGAALAARGLQVANFRAGPSNGTGANASNGGGGNGVQPIASRSSANLMSANAVSANTSTSATATANVSGARAQNASESNRSGESALASNPIGTTEDARKSCVMDRGWSGSRPSLVVRYETGDLSHLPGDLEQRIQSGRYRAAAVGACEAGSSRGFTRFRVAVLLY